MGGCGGGGGRELKVTREVKEGTHQKLFIGSNPCPAS